MKATGGTIFKRHLEALDRPGGTLSLRPLHLAEVHLEEKGIKADFGGFEEEIYQDTDFKLLYRPDMDGIEDSPEFSHMGIGPLRFDEWFEPFLNATTPVHPYSVD